MLSLRKKIGPLLDRRHRSADGDLSDASGLRDHDEAAVKATFSESQEELDLERL